MMFVRPMAGSDLQAVVRISDTSPEAAAWSLGTYERWLQDPAPGRLWVAEQAGAVVGFIGVRVADRDAELLNLAVGARWRRQGVASQLIERALEEVMRQGAVRIFLEVRESNTAAIRLYERVDFRIVGRRPRYYATSPAGPPEDALIFSRSLRPPELGGPGKSPLRS